ncbi:MAG: threonine/serine dehydratase [Alphaproteobacteria bacterium]|nr:threonine/serine dehydratase [Alphaproteobacteria bacterium]
MSGAPTLAEIEATHARIRPHVRRTPVLAVGPQHRPAAADTELWLKLECQQVIGSFKARGAMAKLATLPAAALKSGLITASGGNHGLGVAYAGHAAKVPAHIYLPRSTPAAKIDKLKAWGAQVTVEGAVWDEANAAALATAKQRGLTYVHPFADPAVIAGQGTVGLEFLADVPALDVLLVAIGGGGLISGVALAAKALKPEIVVIGVEPLGAPTLQRSLAAGRLVELETITTRAGTLAPRRSEQLNFDIIRQHVREIVLVSDDAMLEAARWLWFECGIAAELSGAAALAALLAGAYRPPTGARIGALVCGAGSDGIG